MDTHSETTFSAAPAHASAKRGIEATFNAHYTRIARVIARVTRDPSRAEELAVEVFLKMPAAVAGSPQPEPWLHRAAIRLALDELRRQARGNRLLSWLPGFLRKPPPTPADVHGRNADQDRVRTVLAALPPRDAELLLLRSDGFEYRELAQALQLNPASVGKLLARAQDAFRKEYVRRYER